jgi:hypothetical protein
MGEDSITDRAAKRAFRDVPLRIPLLFVFLGGLLVWGIGALICSFLHVSSGYALALAVVSIVLGYGETRYERHMNFFGYLAEELETSLKDHVTHELRNMSEQLGELKRNIGELKREVEDLEARARLGP